MITNASNTRRAVFVFIFEVVYICICICTFLYLYLYLYFYIFVLLFVFLIVFVQCWNASTFVFVAVWVFVFAPPSHWNLFTRFAADWESCFATPPMLIHKSSHRSYLLLHFFVFVFAFIFHTNADTQVIPPHISFNFWINYHPAQKNSQEI